MHTIYVMICHSKLCVLKDNDTCRVSLLMSTLQRKDSQLKRDDAAKQET